MTASAEGGGSGLWQRVGSSIVLMPVALAAVWYGSVWMTLLVAAAAGLMAWEWGKLVGRIFGPLDGSWPVIVAAGSVLVAGLASARYGLVVAGAGLVLEVVAYRRQGHPRWNLAGLIWIILGCIGFVWLREQPFTGFRLCVWILAIVWAVDIAAYVAGRTIGGPRLAPRISPKKTWAGLIGGIAAAALVGLVTTWEGSGAIKIEVILLSAGLAVVEQMGDMAESYAKRRFGVKDSSDLIPGHGGMLDRLDGMLAVVIVMAVARLINPDAGI